jgi:hypothetical protein
MKKKSTSQFLLALTILLTLVACNQADKKEEPAAATDSTTTEAVQPVAEDAVPDAIKAAPDLYKVLSDSMGIRIVEATYKPGGLIRVTFSSRLCHLCFIGRYGNILWKRRH